MVEDPDIASFFDNSSGFAGLGALGGTALVGSLQFSNDAAGKDFLQGYGGSGGCDDRGGTWEGAGSSLLNRVKTKHADFKAAADAGSSSASTFLEAWERKAKNLISTIDNLERHDAGSAFDVLRCGRSDNRERDYKAALSDLRSHLLNLANRAVPKALIQTDSGGGGGSRSGGAVDTSNSGSSGSGSGGGGGNSGGGGGGTQKEKKFPLIPVIGGGVLLLGLGTVLLLRKRR